MNQHPYYGEKVIKVYAPCAGEWINEQRVECLDISEGMQGEDRLNYKCPLCGGTHTSQRRG